MRKAKQEASANRHLAIYPGTFDPLTLGHVDLIERAARIFDHLIVAVVATPTKNTLFSLEERLGMTRDATAHWPNVQVEPFDGLLVDFVRQRQARVIVRGLRAFSDFEYEFQMALTNRKMAPDIETLFLMPKETCSYISSSMVRQVAERGGNLRDFVPPAVLAYVRRKFGSRPTSPSERKRKQGT